MEYTELHTDRLILRKVSPEVVDYVYKNLTDLQLIDFFGLKSANDLSVEKEKYRAGLSAFNTTFLYFIIIEKKSLKVIGWCGYHTWFTKHNRAELGYALYNDSIKKQGLMTEALNDIIQYGFNVMKLHRIEALTSDYNIASIKTLAKFGFVKEGILREHYLVNDIMENSVMFSLLKHEYSSVKKLSVS